MKTQKTLFGTDWNITGSNVLTSLYEKPVDVIIIDELDKCHQHNLEYAYDRLGTSEDAYIRKVGNPTFANYGIDAEFAKSTAHRWLVKCEHCNEKQSLSWTDNVVDSNDPSLLHTLLNSRNGGDVPIHCRHCKKPINRLGPGEWVAEYPDRQVVGYHVSKLFADCRQYDGRGRQIIAGLITDYAEAQGNPIAEQRFWNNDMGQPYDVPGSKIDESTLARCVDENYLMPNEGKNAVAGIDLGNQLHCHISQIESNKRRKLFIGTITSYDELATVLQRYGVITTVLDAGGDIHAPREFARRFPGCYFCRYGSTTREKIAPEGKKGNKLSYGFFQLDPVSREITVNRTESLDIGMTEHQCQRVIYPRNWRYIDEGNLLKQMTALTKIKVQRSDGTYRYVWAGSADIRKKIDDHHRHADNYEMMAARLHQGGDLMIIQPRRTAHV